MSRKQILASLVVVVILGIGVAVGVGLRRHNDATPGSALRTRGAGPGPHGPALSGRAPADNPGAQSVRDAIRTNTHPERLSPLIPAHPFDKGAFEANPRAYLDVVEPGRCFQTGQATGPGSVYLQAESATVPVARGGDNVPLLVRSVPLMPVTFTAFGAGQFSENTLNSVSVQADARGFAVVHFVIPRDFTGRIPVLVGSPAAIIGNQTFLIDVKPPAPERSDG